jgi:membrane-associated protease RseP (regulator of RpoE activity)
MMSLLIIYDLSFLVLFTLAVVLFLYTNRKNIAREGILYLYKTQLGVKFIDFIGKKYGRIIRALHYPVIVIGYLLFAAMMFVIGQTIYIYLKMPQITEVVKTPPLLPLIPYFPQIFGAESLFPPFYFIYFLLALIIVAFSHEFSHGIFARANNVRIKSTGVAFLGPILGAFVEQDDKQMNSKGKIPQMAILGAGVFANMVMAIIFFLLLIGVFQLMFSPAGIAFSSYSLGAVNTSSITNITTMPQGILSLNTQERQYLVDNESYNKQLERGEGYIIGFINSPALKANLSGAIQEINGEKITSFESFVGELDKYGPGDNIEVKTTTGLFNITLDKHPSNESEPFLGVGFRSNTNRKVLSRIIFFKDPNIHYQPANIASKFTYDLLWWIAMINLMVGLFNMLPFGFLDGGRFFYLTVLGITKSEKSAQKAFAWATRIILGLFVLLMLVWLIAFKIR